MMPKDATDTAVGRTEEISGGVTPVLANMLGATIRADWHFDALREGDVLPTLWHWVGFPQDTPMEGIGPDGHPRLGGFLPDLGLGRRMWAGGKLTFRKPLHVGERLVKKSVITNVDHKETASGPMAIVSLDHVIAGENGPAIEESQSIVYLRIPDSYRPPKPIPAPDGGVFDDEIEVDSVRLFRFSAATFNGHKIHYDRLYAMQVEHYPGLIVHGPLQAMFLIERAIAHRGGEAPVTLSHRGVHPCFEHQPVRLIGVEDGRTMSLCTATRPEHGGHQCMQVKAEWA